MRTDLPVRRRRRFSPEFKASLVMQCQPGVSVSAVALANGINANQLRRWIRSPGSGLSVSHSLPARRKRKVENDFNHPIIEVNTEAGVGRCFVRTRSDVELGIVLKGG